MQSGRAVLPAVFSTWNVGNMRSRHLHKSYRMESWLANTDAHVISVSAWLQECMTARFAVP